MIPHPTTWQNASERRRHEMLAAVERQRRESRALAGGPRVTKSAVRAWPAGWLPALVLRAALVRMRPTRRPQHAARLVPKRI